MSSHIEFPRRQELVIIHVAEVDLTGNGIG